MMQFQSRIGIALDELSKKGFKAFMMTVTVPHFREMSCWETSEILRKAWNDYMTYNKNNTGRGVRARFFRECQITHHVRVLEYTFGRNGWHPHFHILYWVPADKFSLVADFEEGLREYWLKRIQITTIRHWVEHHLHGATADNISVDAYTGQITVHYEGENATISCLQDVVDFTNKHGLNAFINGVAGTNRITNTGQYATVVGGEDNDIITNSVEEVTITGGDGNDTIRNSAQSVSIGGGEGADSIYSNADNVTITGDGGDDTIKVINCLSKFYIDGGSDDNNIQLYTPPALDINLWLALRKLFKAKENPSQRGIYISKNDDGIISMHSSNYLAGINSDGTWGGDAELASYVKTARAGHYTPLQMLEQSYKGNDFLFYFYIDFIVALTERCRPRVRWSRSDICKIIDTAQRTAKYTEWIKKKSTMSGELEIILSFSKDEWSRIYFSYDHLPANILYLAVHDKRLLYEFLDGLGIEYSTEISPYHLDRLHQYYDKYAA